METENKETHSLINSSEASVQNPHPTNLSESELSKENSIVSNQPTKRVTMPAKKDLSFLKPLKMTKQDFLNDCNTIIFAPVVIVSIHFNSKILKL